MSLEMLLSLLFTSQSSYLDPFSKYQILPVVVQEERIPENTEYCQTVYWYPNALELLEEARCDVESTEREIKKAKRG